jgi:hypothetical protein
MSLGCKNLVKRLSSAIYQVKRAAKAVGLRPVMRTIPSTPSNTVSAAERVVLGDRASFGLSFQAHDASRSSRS